MTITATTLSGAITSQQTQFGVASAAGITAPNFQTGAGITILYIDQEQILVTTAPNGTSLSNLVRGFNGTPAQAHVSGAQVQIGLPTDFVSPQALFSTEVVPLLTAGAQNWPAVFLAGAADAVPATVPGVYVVKTAGVDAMTIATPLAAAEGNLIYISSDTANAHTLTAASACISNGTAAATVVTFKAFKGSNILMRVCNLTYHVISSNVTSIA